MLYEEPCGTYLCVSLRPGTEVLNAKYHVDCCHFSILDYEAPTRLSVAPVYLNHGPCVSRLVLDPLFPSPSALLIYIRIRVPATFIMEHNEYDLGSAFFSNSDTAPTPTPAEARARVAQACPPPYQIAPHNFVPAAPREPNGNIDALLSANGSVSPAPEAMWARVVGGKMAARCGVM